MQGLMVCFMRIYENEWVRARCCDVLAEPIVDPEAGCVDTETEHEGSCPRVDLNNPVYTEVDNSPETSDPLPLEDSGDGADHSDQSDGPDLVEQTALQQFASTLQEAQQLAVQLERDKARQKRKTPKTYQGDSRMMLYCREKVRKALASEGFLDIGSFMALKEQEREERKQERERERKRESHREVSDTPTIADRMTSGGLVVNEGGEDEDEIIILPGPADRARY